MTITKQMTIAKKLKKRHRPVENADDLAKLRLSGVSCHLHNDLMLRCHLRGKRILRVEEQ